MRKRCPEGYNSVVAPSQGPETSGPALLTRDDNNPEGTPTLPQHRHEQPFSFALPPTEICYQPPPPPVPPLCNQMLGVCGKGYEEIRDSLTPTTAGTTAVKNSSAVPQNN